MTRFLLLCFAVSVMTKLCLADSTTLANETDSACRGPKGEKGNYGHPGIRGLRGFKGIVGPSGPKGDGGDFGPTGPPGSQGPKGSVGEMGAKGSRGEKGQKGSTGPRGVGGSDGEPGVAGHTGPVGPRGSKGEKGLKGIAGLTGPRGPQGVPGDPIGKETLEKYFNPVKGLQAEVSLIKATIQSLDVKEKPAAQKPAAHLHGSGKYGTYWSGTLVTQWYTGSGQWYSPILRGGMTYSGGYITVPKDGIYYIYAQLHYDPRSIQNFCGLLLYLNDRIVDYAYAQNQSPNGNQWGSRYTGLMKIVNKEDTLSVKVAGPCYYCFYTETSQFGAFRVD